MSRNFTRKIEDFVCVKCGAEVHGNGYTDHCTECLYSLHVDNMPGDRKCDCMGLMKPIGALEDRHGTFIIHYKCTKCGIEKDVKASPKDNRESLLKIS
ncbi:MAG: RNHCP domain-containing protein [Candidatus Marsarchaeota archaeon]|nr:RNHCP domain-containing protein [Candidatus Marsarchaeota archaeon]MCL5102157.1 RNHCP domain-containing protein [Candidatus Marsarchaeota archaeon]